MSFLKNIYARISLSALLWLVAEFLLFYFLLPPLNVRSVGFWLFLLFAVALFLVLLNFLVLSDKLFEVKRASHGSNQFHITLGNTRLVRIAALALGACLAVLLLALILSSSVFHARRYASVITVNECEFAKDMPKTDEVTNIALMDTDSARILGTRKLGELSDVVSQFAVSDNYVQINYRGTPKKVAPLEYEDVFKWLNNRKNGIPGYIMVDAVGNFAEYVRLAEGEGIRYADSAYLSEDLTRALRFAYPTKIFGNISFEVNEEGKPFYVVSCLKPRVGLFGAKDVSEVILFNPVDGSHELLALGEVPRWVDIVYDGDLVCEKYNWQGTLSGGFFNSIIGNKGCKQTTDDFGYLMLDDDVWYFTGVTSVSGDASNIGFILSNARTGEYKYYAVNGAEEHSAMGAAEGEVQEKRYTASFPALVNIAGEPSYIMVLKDDNGLVKLYALVNVEQYNIVATGETQAAAINAYKKLLADKGVDVSGGEGSLDVIATVDAVRFLPSGGTTTIYITATVAGQSACLYKLELTEANEELLLLAEGDTLRMTVIPTDNERVFGVLSYEWQ